jgi:hypothetical protein
MKIYMVFLLCLLVLFGCENSKANVKTNEESHTTTLEISNDVSSNESNENDSEPPIVEEESYIKLNFSSQYRYKNSYQTISIVFDKIEIVDAIGDFTPNNEVFLLFYVTLRADSVGSKSQIIHIPDTLTGPNFSVTRVVGTNEKRTFKYINSCNETWVLCPYNDNTAVAAYINLIEGFIILSDLDQSSKSPYNINYITTVDSHMKRVIVFDMNYEDAINPENYLEYDPNAKPGEEKEHPIQKIYFSEYISYNELAS